MDQPAKPAPSSPAPMSVAAKFPASSSVYPQGCRICDSTVRIALKRLRPKEKDMKRMTYWRFWVRV
jgi:hypothetical protein